MNEMSEKIKGTKKGDVLLDATTLVFSNDLLVDKKVSVETVFDLGVLLESLVLNERILTVQPANDPKNKFENVKKFIGDDFIEAVNVSHDGGRQWEYFEWCRLLQEGKSFFPIK
ncbi:MAG: hypothetical protein U9Q22_02600, partial [Candidatus Altiarchaeota archaeon]|nr:hypothetical protein [Candidatus Altiarchaeota archaeon]